MSKADSLDAKVSGILERNPWLDAVTERDIIAETDSVRGIIRTAFQLLERGQVTLIYEYFEHCLSPRTTNGAENTARVLRGSLDDFLDIAGFCEIHLQDSALGAEFLAYFIRNSGNAAAISPEYLCRLLRIGNLSEAVSAAHKLNRLINRSHFIDWYIRIVGRGTIVTEFMRWRALNALSLCAAYTGEWRRSKSLLKRARRNRYARLYKTDQSLIAAEILTQLGEYDDATKLLPGVDEADKLTLGQLYLLGVILTKLGDSERAAQIRALLEEPHDEEDEGDTPIIPRENDREEVPPEETLRLPAPENVETQETEPAPAEPSPPQPAEPSPHVELEDAFGKPNLADLRVRQDRRGSGTTMRAL